MRCFEYLSFGIQRLSVDKTLTIHNFDAFQMIGLSIGSNKRKVIIEIESVIDNTIRKYVNHSVGNWGQIHHTTDGYFTLSFQTRRIM
jgi:hypothetical protein